MPQHTPPLPPPLRVALIGAGLSGLAAARLLVDEGLAVTVFDKGRGPGGRLSTRRSEPGGFDHGAQYFTARDERFQRQVRAWEEAGVVAVWPGRFGTLEDGAVRPEAQGPARYVGVPGMSAVAQQLASGLDVRSGVRVQRVQREAHGWRLTSEAGEGLGVWDAVVAAVPAPQAVPLLAEAPRLAERAASAVLEPCWAAMVHLEAPLPLALDGVFLAGSELSWAARDSSKPGRAPGERWVLHASPGFSRAHLEEAPEGVAPLLVEALARAARLEVRVREVTAHRWRFARPVAALPEAALFDSVLGLGACGDWCAGPRVEGAFLSGLAVARRVVEFARGRSGGQ